MTEANNKIADELLIPEPINAHSAWFRLCNQLNWYDIKSQYCQRWYKRMKVIQVVCAALIPATSLLPENYAKLAASFLGLLIAVLEAIQQLNQYSTLWFSYRATAERLKHEKFLFLSGAGAYKDMPEAERLITLAERVEEHVSTEHANWFNECNAVVASKHGGM